jgi:malonyl-CoA O-methyltransferase
VNVLAATEAYRLWAPTYSAETAISHLEDELVSAMTPPLAGLRLLDAGCGTGRRLVDLDAEEAVGVDLCAEMLAAGARRISDMPRVRTITGDIRALPFAEASFDVAWCRLVIGHTPDCRAVYRELARVVAPGGRVIVSDFHPIAYAAGHRRTFRAGERVHEIEHHVHDLPTQVGAAADAGLESIAVKEACVGPSVEHFYRSSQLSDRYDEQRGLPVVLALSFRRIV